MIGISIANSLGLNKKSGINPDAQAFITAAGITGTTEVNAVNALVNGLQTDGLWTKMKAVYPFVTDNKNLLSYTNTLTNSYWQKSQVILTSGQSDPNGGTNATQLAGSSATNAYLFGSGTTVIGQTYTASVYIKGDASGSVSFRVDSSSSSPSNPINYTTSWQRFTYTFTALSTNADWVIGGYNTWTGSETIYVYAPQLELGSTATAYQPIATTQQAYIASQFKYNLKDPRDLDAAFRLVFNGGWTHSSTGATPNGTNGYADTKLNDNTVLNLNDVHSSVYSRTNVDGAFCDLGVSGTVNSGVNTFIRLTNKTYFRLHEEDVNTVTTNDSRGFFLGWRNSSTIKNIAVNGTKTAFTSAVGGKSNGNIYLGALYNIPTVSATSFSPRQLAFSSIGDGLTDTEATNLYTRVQAFQTALSRQI